MRPAIIAAGLFATSAPFGQGLTIERQVAPEFRAQYEQRQREKAALAACQRKADTAKVLVRDRAKFVIDCLDHPEPEQPVAGVSTQQH